MYVKCQPAVAVGCALSAVHGGLYHQVPTFALKKMTMAVYPESVGEAWRAMTLAEVFCGAGVFDGHGIGGRKAAVFAAGEVARELAGDSRTHPDKINREWKAAVTDACAAVGLLPSPLWEIKHPSCHIGPTECTFGTEQIRQCRCLRYRASQTWRVATAPQWLDSLAVLLRSY